MVKYLVICFKIIIVWLTILLLLFFLLFLLLLLFFFIIEEAKKEKENNNKKITEPFLIGNFNYQKESEDFSSYINGAIYLNNIYKS